MKAATTIFKIPAIPVTVSVVLAILVLAITVAYLVVPQTYEGVVIVFGAALAASGAIASSIYMGRTLAVYLEREARNPQEITFRYIERWNDPNMYHVRDACREIMDLKDKPEEERKTTIADQQNLNKNIRPVLNFLEELALSVRLSRGDGDLAKRMFAGIVISIYHVTEPWIRDQRNTRNRPQLWAEFEWLYDEWKQS